MKPSVCIVGGGIAGAATAYALREYEVDVTLYEAGRLGGRMASRRHDGCVYDYGANYLEPPNDRLASLVEDVVGDRLVETDGDVWVFDADGTIEEGRAEQDRKLSGRDGIDDIVRAFVESSDALVETGTPVEHLERTDGEWLVDTDTETRRFDAVALTPPTSDRLLDGATWGTPLRLKLLAAIRNVEYGTIDSVVLGYPFELDVPYYALVNTDKDHDVGWVSRDECKPGHVPGGQSVLIVQLSPAWAIEHPDPDEESVVAAAAAKTATLIGDDRLRDPDWWDHERWHPALPDHGINPALFERALRHDLAIAGDWVAGTGRTYAALQTGLDAGMRLGQRLE